MLALKFPDLVDTSSASTEIRGRRCGMKKKRGPKAFSEKFRREALRLAETRPLTQVARNAKSKKSDRLLQKATAFFGKDAR